MKLALAVTLPLALGTSLIPSAFAGVATLMNDSNAADFACSAIPGALAFAGPCQAAADDPVHDQDAPPPTLSFAVLDALNGFKVPDAAAAPTPDDDVLVDDILPQSFIIVDGLREVSPPSKQEPRSLEAPTIPVLVAMVLSSLLLLTQHRRIAGLWNRCRARSYGARRIVELHSIDRNACLPLDLLVHVFWGPDLVRRFFGRPDYIVLGLHGMRDPLLLYDRNRVARVQASPQFKRHLAALEAEDARTAAKIRRWVVDSQLDAVAAAGPARAAAVHRHDARAARVGQADRLASH